jgi:hypothetical protein
VVALEEGGHAGPPLHQQSQHGVNQSLVVCFRWTGPRRREREPRAEAAGLLKRSTTMTKSEHLWAIGYDDMGRAEQVREEIIRLGWDTHYLDS